MKYKLLLVGLAFLAGFAADSAMSTANTEQPLGNSSTIQMPKDRISESQIRVTSNGVSLDIDNPQWSRFTPTKSMVPFIDKGANAIQVAPGKNCRGIEKGDVISYDADVADGIIIHRVVKKGVDQEGVYFLAKGDNNADVDPERIRCDQIKRVLVAVIY